MFSFTLNVFAPRVAEGIGAGCGDHDSWKTVVVERTLVLDVTISYCVRGSCFEGVHVLVANFHRLCLTGEAGVPKCKCAIVQLCQNVNGIGRGEYSV